MAEPQLTPEYIRKVAHLARLEVREEELPALAARLSTVLSYFERLRGLNLAGVEPLAGAPITSAELGADVPGPVLDREVLMAMAPDTLPPFVKVPKVLGEGGGA